MHAESIVNQSPWSRAWPPQWSRQHCTQFALFLTEANGAFVAVSLCETHNYSGSRERSFRTRQFIIAYIYVLFSYLVSLRYCCSILCDKLEYSRWISSCGIDVFCYNSIHNCIELIADNHCLRFAWLLQWVRWVFHNFFSKIAESIIDHIDLVDARTHASYRLGDTRLHQLPLRSLQSIM